MSTTSRSASFSDRTPTYDRRKGAADRVQEQQSGEVVEVPGFAVEFAENVPWTPIQSLKARLDGRDPCEPTDPQCEHQSELFGPNEPIADPHWYVIRHWPSVDDRDYWEFARVIGALGYKARYIRPYNPRPLINDYLEFDEYVYWCIPPIQMCRTRIEWHQHEPLPHRGRPPPQLRSGTGCRPRVLRSSTTA